MKFDANDWTKVLGTLALGACAVLLILRGDVAHAMVFGSLIVPSLGQLPAKQAAPMALAVANDTVKP